MQEAAAARRRRRGGRARRAPAAQAGDRLVKEPTATGSGGAAATVDALATQAAIDTLRRGGNAIDAAVAAAGVLGVVEPFSCGIGGGGFMVIRTRDGQVTTIDGRETAPAAMRADSFLDERRPPRAFDEAAAAASRPASPAPCATGTQALRRYGTMLAAQALRPGIDVARARLRGRPDVLRPDRRRQRHLLRRRPVDRARSTSTPTARRATSARSCATPTSPRATSASPAAAPAASTAARSPDAMVAGRTAAADRRRGADHTWRPGLMTEHDSRATGDPARADPRRLPRPRRLGHGAAVERRLDRRRGAEHPRGLPAARRRPRRRRCTATSRRRAMRSPTATPTSRDPAFVDVPLRGLLSDRFAAERRALIGEHRPADAPGAAPGDHVDRAARARAARPRTSRSPTRRATSSPTRSRSSRPAATASSCPARASCSTTS